MKHSWPRWPTAYRHRHCRARPRARDDPNVRDAIGVRPRVHFLRRTGRDLARGFSRARRGALAPRRALTPDKEDLYFTLGVSPGASREAVKRAYKRLAKQFHPDVCDAPDAEAKFNAVRSAYETLVAERGNLDNVGTEEWRAKWSAQLRQMRDVEQGRAKVNVRRRRVVRARGVETDETRAEVDDQPVTAASPETRRAAEELERARSTTATTRARTSDVATRTGDAMGGERAAQQPEGPDPSQTPRRAAAKGNVRGALRGRAPDQPRRRVEPHRAVESRDASLSRGTRRSRRGSFRGIVDRDRGRVVCVSRHQQ